MPRDQVTLPDEGVIVGALDPSLPVAVTIATYNEAENLPSLLDGLGSLDPAPGAIVVDDGSPDGTGELADERARQLPGRLAVIHRPGRSGYASAVRRGLAYGHRLGIPVLMTMDADHSHDPAAIPSLLAAIEDADVAIGSRYVAGGGVRNWPPQRVLLSRLGGAFARLVTGMPVRDPTGGFRAYRRPLLDRISLWSTRAEGYGFLMETIFRCWLVGSRIAEVPIVFHDRTRGHSKLSRSIILEAFLLVLQLGWVSRWGPARGRFLEELGSCLDNDQA